MSVIQFEVWNKEYKLTCVGDGTNAILLVFEESWLEIPVSVLPPEDVDDSDDNIDTLSENAESLSGLSVLIPNSILWDFTWSSQS